MMAEEMLKLAQKITMEEIRLSTRFASAGD